MNSLIIVLLVLITGGLTAFLLARRKEGAYPLFEGKLLVKARLAGERPGVLQRVGAFFRPLKLRLLEAKLRLLSPLELLSPMVVNLAPVPVRKEAAPPLRGWEVDSTTPFSRTLQRLNISLAGLVTIFMIVYSLMGFSAKKAFSRHEMPPSGDTVSSQEEGGTLVRSLPGDCPTSLVATDCPLAFKGTTFTASQKELLGSLATPTPHYFQRRISTHSNVNGGGHSNNGTGHANHINYPHNNHANTPAHANHANTAMVPHSNILPVHTNVSHTNNAPVNLNHNNLVTP